MAPRSLQPDASRRSSSRPRPHLNAAAPGTELQPADQVPLPHPAAAAVPIPPLAPESIATDARGRPSHNAEPLVEIVGPDVLVLHSYAQAGWEHAVDRQWMRAELLRRLDRATTALAPGFGLAVFDAWRPLALQRELFDAVGPGVADELAAVAPPSEDPALPPPHLTGGAVDLTLTWQGRPLALGTGFDEFTDLAAMTAFETAPGAVRALRRVLYHALRQHALVALPQEWWHFEYGTRLWSAVAGQPVRYGPATP